MATYNGMTYQDIIDKVISQATTDGISASLRTVVQNFNEAHMQVKLDLKIRDYLYSVAWPSSEQVDLAALDVDVSDKSEVFADAKPMSFLPYESFREMFSGSTVYKNTNDSRIYYTVHGTTMYIEPSITGVTNLVFSITQTPESIPSASRDSTYPDLDKKFRFLIADKILAEIAPIKVKSFFEARYLKNLKDMRNRHLSQQSNRTFIPDYFIK